MRRIGLLAMMTALSAGCAATNPGGAYGPPAYQPPAPGTVPVELAKITLPPYVIEAPDLLAVEVVNVVEVEDRDENGNVLKDEKDKPVKVFKAFGLPVQGIQGQFGVTPDGTISLGLWGRVLVAGLTIDQAREAIRDHVTRKEDVTKPGSGGFKPNAIQVVVDVLQYNSKGYYVIFDGAGNGEQVQRFPVTGSETVLDAIANVQGLSAVASKRNIWVARRSPYVGQYQQILPVDWVAITQHGYSGGNYQLFPGDRIYVKAQNLIAFDNKLQKVFTPIERILGVTLLGANSVNQIKGRVGGTTGQ